jgi:phage FluMu protein Com
MNVFQSYIELEDRHCVTAHLNRPNRLVVFGDSFSQTYLDDEMSTWNHGWTYHLASMLNASILNWSLSGTSLYYSIQNFFYYLKHFRQEYDIIIFVTTSYGRLPTTPDGVSPRIQAMFKNYITGDTSQIGADIKEHFDKMNDTYMFIAEHMCAREDFINQIKMLEAYMNTLQNQTVLINGFNEYGKRCLYDLSAEEEFNSHHEMKDPRCNHLNEENNKKLAKQIHWHLQGNELTF